MDNYQIKPDYSLLAQALSREPGLSGVRHLEQGQDMSQGTLKGKGYFGEIPVNQGGAMTEFSSAYEQDGKMVSHPLLVPTLNKQEIDLLRMGIKPTPEIYKKAQDYAQQRIAAGQSPFATPQELRYPMPTE
tara:strand:- start:228 stop:620 length:393 start_codon:yes stop_codon:yes gene_type:complete